MRKKPINASIAPSSNPERISRFITRHQSAKVISPSDIARMISVEACEPELPPLEMISGMKSASVSALSSSF